MKTYGEIAVLLHSLALALDRGEWSVSRPGCYIPGEEDPDTHWIGGLVGLRAGFDAVAKRRKFLAPTGNRTLVVEHVPQ
jgi:hypothetical protein